MLLQIECIERLCRDAHRTAPSPLDKGEIATRDHPPDRLLGHVQPGCDFSDAEHRGVVNGVHVYVSIGARILERS